MKRFVIIVNLFLANLLNAQIVPDTTCLFAVKGTDSLYLDVYHPSEMNDGLPTVLYVFGGGFSSGVRNDSLMKSYYKMWLDEGYSVVAIDYRLGLKDKTGVNLFKLANEDNPVPLAVADLFSATKYLCENKEKLHVNADNLVLIGSSAGAITVLTAEFERARGSELASELPHDFEYGGIISYSGAVFSNHGRPTITADLAPVMLVHGTADKIVTYKAFKFLKYGLFGTNYISKRLDKKQIPHYTIRMVDNGHEVAISMFHNFDNSLWFVEHMVLNHEPFLRDETVSNPLLKKYSWGSLKTRDLYKKEKKH